MDHSKLNVDELKGLKVLRSRIKTANIPSSKLDETFNIATWNIRHWGQKKRKKCSLHYIAEILTQFDLISVVELRRNVSELKYVLDLLGKYWDVVFSDYVPDAGGNKERIAYIFDTRAVQFTGMATETDGPRKKNSTTGVYEPKFSWWRKPYMASFKAGSFDFVALSVHIQWGTKAGRKKELEELAKWVKSYIKDEYRVDRDIILMGDFNVSPEQKPVKIFKERLSEALEISETKLQGPTGTFNGFSDEECTRKIDYFFIKDLKVLTYRHIDERLDNNNHLSDHLPVMMEVGFEKD